MLVCNRGEFGMLCVLNEEVAEIDSDSRLSDVDEVFLFEYEVVFAWTDTEEAVEAIVQVISYQS